MGTQKMIAIPAVWKQEEFGCVYFCSKCHRVVCKSGKCDCGAYVDLTLPKEQYRGKVRWENYKKNWRRKR